MKSDVMSNLPVHVHTYIHIHIILYIHIIHVHTPYKAYFLSNHIDSPSSDTVQNV